MLRKTSLLIASLIAMLSLNAQELNCRVEVNASQLSGTNKSVFETLQSAINDYMNTTTFTNAQFAANEKIDCQLYLTVKEYTDGVIKGDLQIQSTRPVYNSAYTTTLFNFKDAKIDFAYNEGEPLVYSINNMESQLTAILNFYAYLILAIDFDSFARNGGDAYWERLKQIVQQGQSSGEVGWKAFEDSKNRAALLAFFTEPATSAYRTLLYEYHRGALDQMTMSMDKARNSMTQTLKNVKKVYDANPMSVGLQIFKDSKLDELVNVYSKAPESQRKEVYELLQPIYPSESTRLDKIRKGAEKQ